MQTPSQPSLTRLALGALDINQRLPSAHTSPRKSPSKKHSTFIFDDAAERPVTYSLKEQVLEASLPASPRRAAPSPRRNEKRKAETALLRDAEEALRHAKVARVEEERTAIGHGHMLEKGAESTSEVVGRDVEKEEGEEEQVSSVGLVDLGQRAYSTYQSSQERAADVLFDTSAGQDSQVTNITEPDAGPNPSPSASELRENARALRLRLQFAMYKIKTNQLDIPIARVELLSPTPALPAVASPAKIDDKLPNTQPEAPSTSDDASPQAPAPNVPATADASPSKGDVDATPTPPLLTHTQDATAEGGQGENPASSGGKDCAEGEPCESSVVKDHAADGLLSLMSSVQPPQ